jgi:3,4-dihydroxy 2-butanone 4-phosphate synthase/GTP cyclohydrolase II
MIKKTASTNLPTKYGLFRMDVYMSTDGIEHVALIKGKIQNPMLVRLHSSCVTGDIFSSLKCDCGEQLEQSLGKIQRNESGIVLYLNQEGRGIGLTNKIKAYALQEKGYDTVQANELLGLPADARDYKVAADILDDLKVSKVDLLTNNPDKEVQLEKYGIEIVNRVPLEIIPNAINKDYLQTKKKKMSHELSYI